MTKVITILFLLFTFILFLSFTNDSKDLRKIYSKPSSSWPKPNVDPSVNWKELAPLPDSPLKDKMDSLAPMIELGKILFFDPRLSGGGKISCATCHKPELNWTDGKERSLGHEDQVNRRNSPSLQNVWFYEKLFWDGRSRDLEDQAFAPINSESEMHGDMRELPRNLRRIPGYAPLFRSAFGDERIDPDRIALAIAVFEKTIVSRPSRFDQFLKGKKKALDENELNGLHLFRTKAGCMNCHNGALFADNKFHNNGLAGMDVGLFHVTHKEDDLGKLKTPSLRDITKTGPWLHDGSINDLSKILDHYNQPSGQRISALLKPLNLTASEKNDILAFLQSISADPLPFKKPILPE